MTDPWHLNDDAFWSELDTATLRDEFRASHLAELLDHFKARAGRPLKADEIAAVEEYLNTEEAIQRGLEAYRALMAQMAQALAPAIQAFAASLAAMSAPPRSYWAGPITGRISRHERRIARLTAEVERKGQRPQPRTLHLALAANTRPVHRQRQAEPAGARLPKEELMPRKPATPGMYPARAAQLFIRITASASPDAAIKAGRSPKVLEALFEGQHSALYRANRRKARRSVKKRHPVTRPATLRLDE